MHTPQKALHNTLRLHDESLTQKKWQKNPYPCCQLDETEESGVKSDPKPILTPGNGQENLTHYPPRISVIMACIYYTPHTK